MRTFVKQHVSKNIPDAVIEQDAIGNLYITRGISEDYPCVVAHLDQVQKIHSRDFRVIETRDIIFGYSPSKRQWEGLGADDKNGIWIALQCLARYDVIKIAFFVGEGDRVRGEQCGKHGILRELPFRDTTRPSWA